MKRISTETPSAQGSSCALARPKSISPARRRAATFSFIVALVAWWCAPAFAVDPGEVVDLSATAVPDVVKPGESGEIQVQVKIASGWHVNAHVPSEPYLIPTQLEFEPTENVVIGEIDYPAGEERSFAFNPSKLLATYEGTFTLTVPIEVSPEAKVGGATLLRGSFRYQACNDTRCLPPRTQKVLARLVVSHAAADRDEREHDAAAVGSTPASGGPADLLTAWVERGDVLTYVGAFALGLLLNLTPCVYPLIAVTLAFFGGQAGGSRARVVGLAAIYVLGVSVTFSALGIASALSGSAFGMALQQPVVLIGVAGTLLALAASNFGLYQLRVPAALSSWAGRSGGGVGGALFMGLTMGLVAAPCVGPVLAGLLLIVGTRQDVFFGFSVFFVLALGLGAPYVLLASLANAARGLPRSGGWLAWMERALGFVLVGLALFYVEPLVPAGAQRFLWPGLLGIAGLTLGFLDRTDGSIGFRRLKRSTGLVAVALAVWAATGTGASTPIVWEPFSPEALETARRSGRPAVIDFTADWCIPCREMDASTFVDREVVDRARSFAMLRADVTVLDTETDAVMRDHRVLGVPTYLFFAPSGDEVGRLVGFVPSDQFVRAMETALNPPAVRSGPAASRS